MRSPQGHQQPLDRTPVLKPSSNSIVPVAWITGPAPDSRSFWYTILSPTLALWRLGLAWFGLQCQCWFAEIFPECYSHNLLFWIVHHRIAKIMLRFREKNCITELRNNWLGIWNNANDQNVCFGHWSQFIEPFKVCFVKRAAFSKTDISLLLKKN